MLNGRLELHDVRDVEAFCRKLVNERWDLRPHERDDLLAYLVATCWELSLSYKRGKQGFPSRFSVYATNVLRGRAVDWYRKERGRTRWQFAGRVYERERAVLVEYDEGTVGEAGVDPGERDDPVESGLDSEGSIPAAAYFPSGDFLASRGIRRPQDPETGGEQIGVEAA